MAEYDYRDSNLGCAGPYLLKVITPIIKDYPRQTVLADLGCGNGSMLAQFRPYGWELHGLELSVSGLEEARKAYPGIDFSQADLITDLSSHPLAGRCDIVISTEVVEHVFLPRPYVKNCFDLLKPGGLLLISTPYHGYLKNVVLSVMGRLDNHFTVLWDYGHIKFWSKKTLTTVLAEAGFENIEFHGAGRIPYLWKSMVLVARKKRT